jgi:hypothetical protein
MCVQWQKYLKISHKFKDVRNYDFKKSISIFHIIYNSFVFLLKINSINSFKLIKYIDVIQIKNAKNTNLPIT